MSSIVNEERREGRAWKTLFFVSMVNSAQAAIAVVGIPSLAAAHKLGDTQLTSLLAALPISAGAASIVSGALSDGLGRKRTLLAGLTILAVALALHPLAVSYPALLALRVATGVGTGILMGLPSSLLSDSFPKNRQQALSGKALCGYAIGQTIGIPLGIGLMEWSSFLWVCLIYGALAAISIPFAYSYLPDSARLPRTSKYGKWLTNYATKARETMTDKNFALITVSSFLSFTALSAFYVTFALWLFSKTELRPTEIAPMYLAGGAIQVLVFTFVLRSFSKLPPQLTIVISLLVNTLIFSSASPGLQSVGSATVLFALTLGAVALRIPGLQYLVNNRGDPAQKGLRLSITQSSSHLGKAFGSILAGSLFPILEVHQIVLCCGVITLFCTLLFLRDLYSELNTPKKSKSPQRDKGAKNSMFTKMIKQSGSGTHVAN